MAKDCGSVFKKNERKEMVDEALGQQKRACSQIMDELLTEEMTKDDGKNCGE